MGTQRVQMKGFPSLVGLVGLSFRAGTRDFYHVLAALVGPVQNIFFLSHRTLFQFIVPHLPASWAGSRVGSPVS